MKHLLFLLLILIPSSVLAHAPVLEGSSELDSTLGIESNFIGNPTKQSLAVYGSLDIPGEVDVYHFTVANDSTIPIEALVPVRESHEFFHPQLIIAHPSFSEPAPTELNLPEEFKVITISPPATTSRDVFFEPFSQERLYAGTEAMIDVKAGETYFVFLSDPRQQTGDYSLGVGTVENFQDETFGGVLSDVFSLKFGVLNQNSIPWNKILSLFIIFAGFIIGLGAVTVIDLHGVMARKSSYWTEATIRSHKITKPLIWIGMALIIFGTILMYKPLGWTGLAPFKFLLIIIMIFNGAFLSFYISPALLKQEKNNKSNKLLPKNMQLQIGLSFIISFLSWWVLLLLFIWHLVVLS